MKSVRHKILPLVLALTNVPAVAEEMVLEEVIVIARKRVENQQEVPISIKAVSGDEMRRLGLVRFEDVQMANPNVRMRPSSGEPAIATTIAIRGNLQNDSTTQLDPSVGVYVDGMILARTFGVSTSMVDVQSVQTLKGPQGTLFGRNTTGGAILIQTNDPAVGEGISGYISGEVGTEDIFGAEGAVDIPLGGQAALRLMGYHREWGEFLEYKDGTELGDRETQTLRAKLLWNLGDKTTVKLNAEHGEIDATAPTQTGRQPNDAQLSGQDNIGDIYPTPFIPGVSTGEDIITTQVATDEAQNVESDLYILSIDRETRWGQIKFISGYREVDVEAIVTISPGLGFTRQDKPDLENFTAELQLNGLFLNEKLELTSGLYYFDETTHEDQTITTYEEIREVISIFPEQVIRIIAENESESLSAYLQGDYSLTDKMRLTLGGRYTSDERNMDGTYSQLGEAATPLRFDYDESEFNYLVSFDYLFSDDVLGYAKTGTGYRSGGAGLAPDPERSGLWQSFDPEDVTNYEVGLKSEWLDNRLRVNAALFYQDYENYQYSAISVATGIPQRLATVSDATIQGGEIELTALLPANFSFALTYGHTDSEIDGGVADGDPLPNIPEKTMSVILGKYLPTDVGDFDLRLIFDWRDESYSQVGFIDESTLDDRELLNIVATYTNGPWTVTGYVNNALDEEFYNGLIYGPSSSQAFGLFGVNYTNVGLPRMAGIKVGYEF